jgi:copper transport protein
VRRSLALLLGLLAALGTVLLIAAPSASAHATVVSASPADGARLTAAPAAVTITFDESVGLSSVGYLRVVDESGNSVTQGAASHPNGYGTKVTVALRPGLGDGTYTSSYRVISADSHPVSASLRFVVGTGALAPPVAAPPTVNQTTSVAFDVVRWISNAGLIFIGGAWLLVTVWPEGRDDRRARQLLWIGWWATTAAALGELLVQGPYTAGTGLADLFNGTLIDATLHSTFGTAHSARLILLGLLGIVFTVLLRDGERARLPAGLMMIGVFLTFGFSGHPEAQHPSWLALTSTAVHLAAMSAWIGGLVYLVLAVLPRGEPDEYDVALPTFSRVAYVSVVALLVSGTYQAYLGIGSWDAITSTRYGQLVLVKAGLFFVIVAVGNLARVAIARTIRRRQGELDVRRMRVGVLVEVVLALVVLGVTSVLVAEPLGQAAEITAAAGPESATVNLGNGRTAVLTISPHRHGPVAVTVTISAGVTPTSVTLTAAQTAKQLGPITIPLTTTDKKTYSAANVLLPAAGTWTFALTVQTSQFDSVTAAVPLSLK